jgi:hypothetical protein
MTAPLVTILASMPMPEQLRLWNLGRTSGAVIVYRFDDEDAGEMEEYATHGDPDYHERYSAAADHAEYRRQIDRFPVA